MTPKLTISAKLYFFLSIRVTLKKSQKGDTSQIFFHVLNFIVFSSQKTNHHRFFSYHQHTKKSNKNGNRKGRKKSWCVWLKTARITKTLQCRLIFITCEILSKQKSLRDAHNKEFNDQSPDAYLAYIHNSISLPLFFL